MSSAASDVYKRQGCNAGFSGDGVTCAAILCTENESVFNNTCVACAAGTTNAAGDDASGADTSCGVTYCGLNEFVSGNSCEACAAGTTNAAGDDASGDDTSCGVTYCGVNEFVSGNTCEACAAGTTNASGDDASGEDTACDANMCLVDEYVSGNTCVACDPGYTNYAGDDPAGGNTSCTDIDECSTGLAVCDAAASCYNAEGTFYCICDEGYSGDGQTCTPIICAENEYVSGHVCTACSAGTTNIAGDYASEGNTSCDESPDAIVGVTQMYTVFDGTGGSGENFNYSDVTLDGGNRALFALEASGAGSVVVQAELSPPYNVIESWTNLPAQYGRAYDACVQTVGGLKYAY